MTFQFDTSGEVHIPDADPRIHWSWPDLSPFVRGYVEAMPWEELSDKEFERQCKTIGQGAEFRAFSFSDLAPETLARIMEDCVKGVELSIAPLGRQYNNNAAGGACFYQDRQTGRLAEVGFPPLTVYLGNDGKIYFKGE